MELHLSNAMVFACWRWGSSGYWK